VLRNIQKARMLSMEDGPTGLKITLNAHAHVRVGYSTGQDNVAILCKLNCTRLYTISQTH
jgi:hypothetical protein